MFGNLVKMLFSGAAGASPLGWLGIGMKAIPFIIAAAAAGWGVTQIVSCTQQKNVAVITKQADQIKDLGGANKELAKDNTNIQASGGVTIAAVVQNATDSKVIQNKFIKREASVAKKLDDNNKTIDNLGAKTPENEKQRSDNASTIQIDAMWASYCDASPSSTQCKAPS